MEIISTIKERYKICTFACLIGFIILLLNLNHGHDIQNLSRVRRIALYISSLNQYSPLQISPPSNFTQNQEQNQNQISPPSNFTQNQEQNQNQNREICNFFEGKWVYNPKKSPIYSGSQCPFLSDQVSCQRNGRPDFDYEKWSWEATGCQIPRFNGTDMLERLRGKRMIIVGDSLNRNMWESHACLLYSAINPSRAQVNFNNGEYKLFRAKDYNCSVEFYWSPFLVELKENKQNGQRILMVDRISGTARKWKGADIMVFNTGHWWVHAGKNKAWDLFGYKENLVENMESELALEMAMKTWARWIHGNVDRNRTTVFFRSISPEHKGKNQSCSGEIHPIMDESYVAMYPKPMIEIVERTLKSMSSSRVRYLNITKLSEYRRDGHPAVYAKKGRLMWPPGSYGDCSHWCLPGLPDTWNRLLYASLVSDTSREISYSSNLVA